MKVQVNMPGLPEGAVVSVHGFGELLNLHEYEYDDDAVGVWKQMLNLPEEWEAPETLYLGLQPEVLAPEPLHTPVDEDHPSMQEVQPPIEPKREKPLSKAKQKAAQNPVEVENKAPDAEGGDK